MSGGQNLGLSISALNGFARRERGPQAVQEKCDLCAVPIYKKHRHLIEPGNRKLSCVCDPCALVFDETGITKYRKVPRDARRLDDLVMPDESWEKLLIPINLAFLYKSSAAKRVVALYPSPAGVTESLLDLSYWSLLEKFNPGLLEMKEDVEALLVNRLSDQRDYFIAPIDRCFELVGLVRKHWSGYSGGDKVQSELGDYFSRLREETAP